MSELPPIGAEDPVGSLRRAIAALEGKAAPPARRAGLVEADAALPLGAADLDRRLGPAGGLALGALHEIACDETREVGAVTGFAAALLARLLAARGGRLLWITTPQARRETGRLDAPGLAAFGLDPARLVEVVAERVEDALWACEEGLACRATAAVVAEIPGRPPVLDLTATRRLSLRAGETAGRPLALLLRVCGPPQTTAAATRWRVRGRPSRRVGGFAPGLGAPAFRLELEKNRDGRLAHFDLEWNPHERRFSALPPYSGAPPAPPADGSAAPPDTGRVLAFERAARR